MKNSSRFHLTPETVASRNATRSKWSEGSQRFTQHLLLKSDCCAHYLRGLSPYRKERRGIAVINRRYRTVYFPRLITQDVRTKIFGQGGTAPMIQRGNTPRRRAPRRPPPPPSSSLHCYYYIVITPLIKAAELAGERWRALAFPAGVQKHGRRIKLTFPKAIRQVIGCKSSRRNNRTRLSRFNLEIGARVCDGRHTYCLYKIHQWKEISSLNLNLIILNLIMSDSSCSS